jgi:uncharacterized protein YdeI (YjbR/CyaY-like superfamily)
MSTTPATKKIDVALAKAPPHIQEITGKIRLLIHKTEPTIREAWKWGPAFEKNKLIMGLWGFKEHVSFVFYRGAEMSDKHKLFNYGENNARNRMIKLTSLKDFNEKKFADYIKEAVKVDAGEKKTIPQRTLALPLELSKWFSKNKKAKTFFDNLAYTNRKEMVLAITGAKQEETRKRRFEKVAKALSAGKKIM